MSFPLLRALPCRLLALLSLFLPSWTSAGDAPRVRVLFLGDRGHHRPADRFRDVETALRARGIDLTYTDRLADLEPKTLSGYDGLMVYANITRITREAEAALLEYVAGGKGFIPVHCASYCFLDSSRYIELVGAQFLRHGTGVFRTTIVEPEHPVLRGFRGFESWDETYVHTKHNESSRVVLERRVEGTESEPWTWVRTHGKGRVFYTAWGHDARTWTHPGFQNLLERGIRYAVGGDPAVVPPYSDVPEMTPPRKDLKPFTHVESNVPFYPADRPWGTIGEPIRKMQAPLEAEESVLHMVTPVGLEPRLFAAEPDIVKPICMAWDERGRLWIAETVDYPNDLQPEGEGNDRIKICEDADRDGKAEKFTVFAEKLSLPTSLAFARGGVIVHQPPHTLFLHDADGDDRADERKVLFTGWSTSDTHAGPSNLRHGLDNWVYGIVGYAGFRGEVGGERHSFQQGFYRFKADGSKLEFLRNTNNNSWGVGFSEEGVCFGSTANGNPSVHLSIPNRYYEVVRGWSSSVLRGIAGNPEFHAVTPNVRQVDAHGRFTAAAGHAIYTARAYPREYWNRAAFVAEPTGHLIATFLLDRQGAEVRSRNAWNLLASDDEWTAPIMAEVGPDGQVWVIDWYNYIVQHNPTPAGFRTGKGNAYMTDLRDKKHGRILRLVHAPAKPREPISLKGASPEALVAALRDDNMLWRLHAQRLLVERGEKDVVPALIEAARDAGVDGIGLNPGVIHALWTLHGLGALDGSHAGATTAAVTALRHASAGVRRNAALVLSRTSEGVHALLESGVLRDPDGEARLAGLLSLSEMPRSPEAGAAAASALADEQNLRDEWLADAVTCAAAAHDRAFLDALARGAPAEPPARALAIVERVAEHHARGSPRESVTDLLASFTADGSPKAVAAAVVAGFARGWPRDVTVPLDTPAEETLTRLFRTLPAAARGQLVGLSARWGSEALKKHAEEIRGVLLAAVEDEGRDEKSRVDAARQLMEFERTDADAPRKILALITVRSPPELAAGLLDAVGSSEAPGAGEAIIASLVSLTPAVRPAALSVLLGKTQWTRALLDAMDRGDVRPGDLSLDQRQALAAHPDRRVSRRARRLLERSGGLPGDDREDVLRKLLPLAERRGDAAAGKVVFLKQCAKCHVHGNEGTRIGPDLTGMAVHPKAELLTQVIDPNRSLEGNFRVYVVLTKDGRALTGLLHSESRTAVELFDAEGKKHVILREDVERLESSPRSLMPEGFEKEIPPDDLVNLLEFLVQRGRYLPLPLGKAATAVSTRGMFTSADAEAERFVFPDWSPRSFEGVPFHLVDPQGDRIPNVVLLHGPQGALPPRMPRSVKLPLNAAAKALHFLSGVSGWGFPFSKQGTVSLIVRLHYEDGTTEDHPLINGEHFAGYNRRIEVPRSKLAFLLDRQQVRYLSVAPGRDTAIREIELVKGEDETAPVVIAVTAEAR